MKTGIHRLLGALLAAGLLASCANVAPDFKFDAAKPNGLVIGSISYESGLARFYLIAKSDTGKAVEFAFGCNLVPCMQPSDDPNFSKGEVPKQRGGGFAVEVPEGTYRISSWRVERGYMISRSSTPIGIEFVVQRGKASYIGNLHFDADWENVKLQDKSLRDLPLLRQQYSILQSIDLAFTIKPDTVVSNLGESYETGIEPPRLIFIPVIKR